MDDRRIDEPEIVARVVAAMDEAGVVAPLFRSLKLAAHIAFLSLSYRLFIGQSRGQGWRICEVECRDTYRKRNFIRQQAYLPGRLLHFFSHFSKKSQFFLHYQSLILTNGVFATVVIERLFRKGNRSDGWARLEPGGETDNKSKGWKK
jgi:hypothetical protein